MNQEEKLDYLLEELLKESKQMQHIGIKRTEKRNILRSLMNIRMPGPVSDEFSSIQDEFLMQEAKEKGIVSRTEIPTVREAFGASGKHGDKISIWQGDITRLGVDAIVNAANSQMLGCFVPCHSCIDNAIHSAAGIQLREACYQMMEQQGYGEPTGKAKITKGYNLPAKYVLHTVGPIINGELTKADCLFLKSCYDYCLELGEEYGLKDIAFCCISTGEFHFPNRKAAEIAVEAVLHFLGHSNSPERIIFNVFKDKDYEIYKSILSQLPR